MKKLVIITGPPGVGKTTICRNLFKSINKSAWLDADWCWMINPWIPKNQEQKKYVEDTFSRILRGYLENENIDIVLFTWVIHENSMFDLITEPLNDLEMELVKIALVSDRESHVNRLKKDGRREEQILSKHCMSKYKKLKAVVIDTSNLTVNKICKKVVEVIGVDNN